MRSLSDLPLGNSTVALRCDFNVPLDSRGVITDDLRIRAALPTIEYLLAQSAKVVILSHLGRPKGQTVDALSLAPVAKRLAELLNRPVNFLASRDPAEVSRAVSEAPANSVTLLENVRFDPRETSKDPSEREALAREWAQWAEFFVSDGFGVVHRSQASVTEIAALVPSAAGLLVERESGVFAAILDAPARPSTVILGGSKVGDKLGVIESLLPRVDNLLIGGGMAYTFLLAQGKEVGQSLQQPDFVEDVRAFMAQATELGVRLLLPVDFVVADSFDAKAKTQIVSADSIPADWMGLDIGPLTRQEYADVIAQSATVVWNGPMGVFEMEPFAGGTLAIAQAMAESGAYTVIGGGDSAAAVRVLEVDETKFDHISTGGGASLEFLEGKTLPGLAVLEKTR